MQLPGLIQFRKCTLTDTPLAEAVAKGLNKMYCEPVAVPSRHIPARPDEDFDLLVGEMVVRFLEKKAENDKVNSIMGKINSIMWKSYMVKDRGIKPTDCEEIMQLLEEWAND